MVYGGRLGAPRFGGGSTSRAIAFHVEQRVRAALAKGFATKTVVNSLADPHVPPRRWADVGIRQVSVKQ